MHIDLLATPTGELHVYNPYDTQQLFYFSGYGTMAVPTGFNTGDPATWDLATSATYNITMSGGAFPLSTMTLCNDATNIPSAHPCGYFQPNGTGYIALDPGFSTLHWAGYMSAGYSGHATLLGAALDVNDFWLVATTPIPGAAWLFASVLLLGYFWRRHANRHA